jgi:hypothetical protein
MVREIFSDHVLFIDMCAHIGMHLLLSITIVAVLSRRRYRSSLGRRLALPFSILMVICSTVTWSVDAWQVENSLVEGHQSQPSPSEYAREIIASVLHTLPLLMSDALLVSTSFHHIGYLLIYYSCIEHGLYWIEGLPSLLSLLPSISAVLVSSTFVHIGYTLISALLGVALAVISRSSNRQALGYVFTFGPGNSLPIVFFSLTIALNLYLTSAIILKLWMARRNLIAVGPLMVAQAQPYMTIIGIFLESALPYSASGIFYICTIMSKSSIQLISGRLFFVSSVRSSPVARRMRLMSIQFLCPAFIVIRIAFGVSYTPPDETTAPLDTHHDWVYHVEQEVRVDPALSPAMITKRRDRRAGRGVSYVVLSFCCARRLTSNKTESRSHHYPVSRPDILS